MRKGNTSIEALISVSVLILFFVILIQILLSFALDDLESQRLLDCLENINNYALAYDLIGYDESLLDDFEDLDLSILREVKDQSKEAFLESIFLSIFHNGEIEIHGDWITGYVPVGHTFLLKNTSSYIYFNKKMLTYGNDPNLFDYKSLVDLLEETKEDEKNVYVYKTKTGSKYHEKSCFYLKRSTTDHDAIERISIYEAKYIYFLTPCKKCMEDP